MVELAITVAAVLFLCWVAFYGFAILCAIGRTIWDDKEMRYGVLALLPFLLLWFGLWLWRH